MASATLHSVGRSAPAGRSTGLVYQTGQKKERRREKFPAAFGCPRIIESRKRGYGRCLPLKNHPMRYAENGDDPFHARQPFARRQRGRRNVRLSPFERSRSEAGPREAGRWRERRASAGGFFRFSPLPYTLENSSNQQRRKSGPRRLLRRGPLFALLTDPTESVRFPRARGVSWPRFSRPVRSPRPG